MIRQCAWCGTLLANTLHSGGAVSHSICRRCFDELVNRHYMNSRQRDRYIAWARPFFESVQAEVGYLDGEIFHLWHGTDQHRSTRARHEGLQRFDFDPLADIAIDVNGSWRWNTDKHEMHDYVRAYFHSRREDG